MFVFAQNVIVVVPWREDREDNAEGVLVTAHQWEKLLYF
jgi:hypothetical protein